MNAGGHTRFYHLGLQCGGCGEGTEAYLDTFVNADLVTIACSFSVAHLTSGACSFRHYCTRSNDRAMATATTTHGRLWSVSASFSPRLSAISRGQRKGRGGDDRPLNECWWSHAMHAFPSSGTRRRDRSLDAFSNANLVTIACSFSIAHLTSGACSFCATTALDRAIERWQRQRQRMGGYGVYLLPSHPIKPALNRTAFPIDFIPCRRSDGVGPSGFLHLAIIAILALLFDLFLARDL